MRDHGLSAELVAQRGHVAPEAHPVMTMEEGEASGLAETPLLQASQLSHAGGAFPGDSAR